MSRWEEALVETQEIELPISQIEVDPENVRSEYDPDIVAGLKSALKVEGGFINPPLVYPIGDKRYRVKHGSTRVMAAQGVLKTIRVRVVEPPQSESTKLLSQMGENLLQGSLRPADIGLALKRLRNADGKERSLSQVVGALKAVGIERTKAWVAMHLALAELAPELQRLINQGRIGGEVGYQLRGLPADEQVEWARRIVDEGITLAELRRLLGGGNGELEPAEWLHRDVSDRLAEAAADYDERGDGSGRRGIDQDRRHSRVSSRWELMPVVVEGADNRKLRPLQTSDWTKRATDVEKQLAQEALFVGGYSARQAIDLVDRAVDESQTATEGVMAALNALRRLVEHPADLQPNSALAEFMAMRMNRVLENIRR
jgi:ParB family transcriptional regulator, chromosome partitioning protein